jgi:hypothetical protein
MLSRGPPTRLHQPRAASRSSPRSAGHLRRKVETLCTCVPCMQWVRFGKQSCSMATQLMLLQPPGGALSTTLPSRVQRDEAVVAAGTCQGFCERHHVGLHAVRLVRPQLPGAPQPALHLVKHQQRARLVARLPQALQELPARIAAARRWMTAWLAHLVLTACMACSRASAPGHLALTVRP